MKPILETRQCMKDLSVPKYATLPDGVLKMCDNSSLFGSNPAVTRAAQSFDFASLARYPSVTSDALREAVGKKLGIDPSRVLTGSGSDEVIDIIAKAFLEPGDTVAVPTPSYEFYGMFAALVGANVVRCPLKEPGFGLDAKALIKAKPKLAFLCSPNNPTGNIFDNEAIIEVVEKSSAVVVLDEAYIEFADVPSLVRLTDDYDNLLVLRTFSKAYGMAGLRVGYCVGSERAMAEMAPARRPFALNSFSEAAAVEALKSDAYVKNVAETNRRERAWLMGRFDALGIKAFPSEANFVLFQSPIPAAKLLEKMLGQGIALRDCGKQPTLKDCARVTIGTRKMNERFIAALANVMGVRK